MLTSIEKRIATIKMEISEFFLESFVMGYHCYQNCWNPKINEVLDCEMQPNNKVDKYARNNWIYKTLISSMKAWASTDIIHQNNLLSCIVMRSKRLVHEPLNVILVLMGIERYLRTHG